MSTTPPGGVRKGAISQTRNILDSLDYIVQPLQTVPTDRI